MATATATYSTALVTNHATAYRPMVFTFTAAVADQLHFCEILAKRMGVDVMVALDAARREPGLLRPDSVLPPIVAAASAAVVEKNCAACGDAVCGKGHQGWEKFSCGHRMHLECSSAMVASYIDQRKPLPFACACSGCTGVMIDPQDDAVFDELNKIRNLCAAYVECANCDMIIRSFKVAPGAQVVKCTCGTSFCIRCKGRPHVAGVTCMQSLEFEKGLADFGKLASKKKKDEVRKWMSIKYSEAFGVFVPMKWLLIEDAIEAGGMAAGLKWTFEFEEPEMDDNQATASYQELLAEAKALVDFSDTEPFVADSIVHPFGSSGTDGGGEACEAKRSKFCPKCFVSIGHDGGCPSMQCPIISCQHRFCYNCLGPEHTHTECKKSIDYSALALAATVAADGSKAISNLYEFTPEAELAEKAAGYRATTLVSRDVIGMRNARIVRLAPMMQLAAMLKMSGGNGKGKGSGGLLVQFEKALRDEQELQAKALLSNSMSEHEEDVLRKCQNVAERIPQSDVDGIVEAGRYQWFDKKRIELGSVAGAGAASYDLFLAINRMDIDYIPKFFKRTAMLALFSAKPLGKGEKAIYNGETVTVNWWGEQSASVSSYLAGVGDNQDQRGVPKAALYPETVSSLLINRDLLTEAKEVLAALKAALRMRLDQTRSRMIEMFYKGIPFIPPPPRALQEGELIEKIVGNEDGHSAARKVVGVITGGDGRGAMPYAWFPGGYGGVRSRVVGAHIVFPECTSLVYQQPIMNEKAALCYDAIVATLMNRSDVEVHPLVRAITLAKEELAGLGNTSDGVQEIECTACTFINESAQPGDKCELCESETLVKVTGAKPYPDAAEVKAVWTKVVAAMKAVLKEVA